MASSAGAEVAKAQLKRVLGRFARFGQNASILVRWLHSTNSPTRTTADPACSYGKPAPRSRAAICDKFLTF